MVMASRGELSSSSVGVSYQRFEGTMRAAKTDLALLPIAPIEPRDPARETHLDGDEAVQAFVDLGAAHLVPIHFDTFPHGADRLGDAARRLTAAARRAGVMDRVHILDVGEQWPPPPRLVLRAR